MSDQQNTQQPTTQVQHVEIPQEIRVFLEAVLDEADLLILNDEEEQLILENMYRQLNVFLMSKVLGTVPEEKVDGFISVSEEGTEIHKLQECLQKEIPNTGEFFEKA